jgi:hypothetical protein
MHTHINTKADTNARIHTIDTHTHTHSTLTGLHNTHTTCITHVVTNPRTLHNTTQWQLRACGKAAATSSAGAAIFSYTQSGSFPRGVCTSVREQD